MIASRTSIVFVLALGIAPVGADVPRRGGPVPAPPGARRGSRYERRDVDPALRADQRRPHSRRRRGGRARRRPLDSTISKIASAQRLQDEYTDDVLNLMVGTIDACNVSSKPIEFMISTGDNADLGLVNEPVTANTSGTNGTITAPVACPAGKTCSGFWEIETASLIDYPQEARIIDVLDNHDGTGVIRGALLATSRRRR